MFFDKFNISSWETVEIQKSPEHVSEETVEITPMEIPVSEINSMTHPGWNKVEVEELAQVEEDDSPRTCPVCGKDHETSPPYPSIDHLSSDGESDSDWIYSPGAQIPGADSDDETDVDEAEIQGGLPNDQPPQL